jgi:hypothetical protein
MDNTQSPVYQPANNSAFFRRRFNPTIALVVALLLFLLPFCRLKCSTYTVAENSGIGLATGQQWKVSFMGIDNDLMKDAGEATKTGDPNKEYKTGVNWFILLALVFGVMAVVFSFFDWQMRPMAVLSAAIVAALLLIAAFIHIKLSIKSQIPTGGNKSNSLDMNMEGLIKVQFTVWYYLSLAGFAIAAFFSYKHHQIELQDKINRVTQFDFQHEVKTENMAGDS